MGGHALKRSFPARAGAALIALAAMAVAVAAAKIDLAKPEQVTDAQAQVKAYGLACDVGKVRYGGEGDMKNKDKKSIHVQVYEVTCGNGFGYLVEGPKGGSADTQVSSCPSLMATAKKGDATNSCQLPENLDVKGQAQALLSKAGISCTVSDAKWIGINPKDHNEGFEVACAAPSPGYVMFVSQTGAAPPHVVNCMLQSYKCTLTTPEQQTAWVKSVASKSGNACDINQSRYVGTDKDGSSFFEVGCTKGVGYMVQVTAAGEFKEAIGCADATNLGGGCTLTDKSLITASGAESWGTKLKAAGVACNVQQARLIGQTSGKRDVVEYQCSDRPAGLIVALPSQAGQKPDVVDCFDARHFGTKCEFTSADTLNQVLNKAFAASGKTCVVSAYQNLGGYENGTAAFEIACGSAPGYIGTVSADFSKVTDVQTCPEAAKTANKTGLSCTLPGNH
jgi:hypothetical protein